MPRCAAALDACAWHASAHHGALPRVPRCAAAFDACADGSHPMVCRACECEGCRRSLPKSGRRSLPKSGRRSLPKSGRRRGRHALRWAPRWAPHWVATQTRRRRHRQWRTPRRGRGRPRRRASWRRATVCRYRSSSHAVRVGSCVWARRMSRPSRTVHGLCATPTPSLRHSGKREYSRITPPRPSTVPRRPPRLRCGTWDLGAASLCGAPRTRAPLTYALRRSYYAGQEFTATFPTRP